MKKWEENKEEKKQRRKMKDEKGKNYEENSIFSIIYNLTFVQ